METGSEHLKQLQSQELIKLPISAEVGESGLRMCRPVPQEVLDAVESVCFIADHLKKGDRENSVSYCNFLL
jgi:hypothetical protein